MAPFPKFLLIAFIPAFLACSQGDVVDVAKIATSGDLHSDQDIATRKAIRYASNPKALERDIKSFEKNFANLLLEFRKAIEQIWGKKETKEPRPKEYVKYTENYRSIAAVDFDKGVITVETLEEKSPLVSLKNTITTTLLKPNDPRAVDLYSASTVKLGKTPFLFGEVKDHEGKPMRWNWRTERFADYLIQKKLQIRKLEDPQKKSQIHYVTNPMIRDHLQVRARKYRE